MVKLFAVGDSSAFSFGRRFPAAGLCTLGGFTAKASIVPTTISFALQLRFRMALPLILRRTKSIVRVSNLATLSIIDTSCEFAESALADFTNTIALI